MTRRTKRYFKEGIEASYQTLFKKKGNYILYYLYMLLNSISLLLWFIRPLTSVMAFSIAKDAKENHNIHLSNSMKGSDKLETYFTHKLASLAKIGIYLAIILGLVIVGAALFFLGLSLDILCNSNQMIFSHIFVIPADIAILAVMILIPYTNVSNGYILNENPDMKASEVIYSSFNAFKNGGRGKYILFSLWNYGIRTGYILIATFLCMLIELIPFEGSLGLAILFGVLFLVVYFAVCPFFDLSFYIMSESLFEDIVEDRFNEAKSISGIKFKEIHIVPRSINEHDLAREISPIAQKEPNSMVQIKEVDEANASRPEAPAALEKIDAMEETPVVETKPVEEPKVEAAPVLEEPKVEATPVLEEPKVEETKEVSIPKVEVKSEVEMKFCTSCGARIPLNLRFCTNCGSKQVQADEVQPIESSSNANDDSKAKSLASRFMPDNEKLRPVMGDANKEEKTIPTVIEAKETKAVEPKVEETPVVEEPKVEETPVVEEPKVEEIPVVEEPKVEETPVVETKAVEPKVEETPVALAKAIEPKVEEAPVVEKPVVEEAKVAKAPLKEKTVEKPELPKEAKKAPTKKATKASSIDFEDEFDEFMASIPEKKVEKDELSAEEKKARQMENLKKARLARQAKKN